MRRSLDAKGTEDGSEVLEIADFRLCRVIVAKSGKVLRCRRVERVRGGRCGTCMYEGYNEVKPLVMRQGGEKEGH